MKLNCSAWSRIGSAAVFMAVGAGGLAIVSGLLSRPVQAGSEPVAQPENQAMDRDAMMKMMEQASVPDEHHQVLARMAGRWHAVLSAQPMEPGGEGFTTTGTMVNTMIMGGRYLQQNFSGAFMGKPMTGQGFTGYHKALKRYEAVWWDSGSTAIGFNVGQAGEDASTITLSGEETDPMTGQTATVKDVIEIQDDDHHVFTRYYMAPDGSQMEGFRVAYTRMGAE